MANASKVEPGKIYRIHAPFEARVRVPVWFHGRLKTDDLLLCTGTGSQGASYLLLDVRDDGVRAVGIDPQTGEVSLSLTLKLNAPLATWQPTRREALSLERGDTLRGEAYAALARELGVAVETNGQRPRRLRAASMVTPGIEPAHE